LGTGVVAQIRRDGVVIEVDGRRVLLPKPWGWNAMSATWTATAAWP